MTFEEWYVENIICDQPWGSTKQYRDSHIYKAMKKAWDAGKEAGRQEGDYMEGLEEGIKIGKLQP